MMLIIRDLLAEKDVDQLVEQIADIEFVDGRVTAGPVASTVKNNLQAPRDDPRVEQASSTIQSALQRNDRFRLFALPQRVLPPMFSRYQEGMSYGDHVDNAVMFSPVAVRTDLAATVFLNAPDEYEGGELLIHADSSPRPIKLARGSAIVYSASSIHRVEEVKSGYRLVAVTWIQSLVRDPAQRAILYDLSTLSRELRAKDADAMHVRAVGKARANLMRMWADT